MEIIEINGDTIIRQKYGNVSDILRNDQMENKDGMVSEKWSDNKMEIRWRFSENEEIVRWRKMEMFQRNIVIIRWRKDGGVSEKWITRWEKMDIFPRNGEIISR
jgi:hypothetical protein